MLRDWFIQLWRGHVNLAAKLIAVTKTTSCTSKLWSVFEKLGLTQNIGRKQRFSAQSEEKKLKPHRGYPNHGDRWPRGDCKLAWISAFS